MAELLRCAFTYASMLLLVQQTCLGQQADPWERVRLIAPGHKVSVTLNNGKSVSGNFQEWSPEGLSVVSGKKVEHIAKANVARVAMATGMSRGRRAAWAALIGGGVGAGIGVAACLSSECDVSPALTAAGGALWIGGISAGIAALIPQHKEVVYRAK